MDLLFYGLFFFLMMVSFRVGAEASAPRVGIDPSREGVGSLGFGSLRFRSWSLPIRRRA